MNTALHYWVHDLSPVAVHLGPLPIRWYGLMYIFGFAIAYALLTWRRRRGLLALPSQESLQDLLFYGFCGVLIGGRLGACLFYEPCYYLCRPWEMIAIWKGGMSSHGGFIGSLVALLLFCRKYRVPFWHVIDSGVIAATPGLCLGRIGNFINGELWGKVTNVPWAVIFPAVDYQPRHPVQLYQAFTEGALLFVILAWLGRKPRPVGLLSGVFAVLYSLLRLVTERYREVSDVLAGPAWTHLTMGQVLSLALLATGIAILLWSARQRKAA